MVATLLIVCIIAFFTSFFLIYFKDLREYLKNFLSKAKKVVLFVCKYFSKFFKCLGLFLLMIISFFRLIFVKIFRKRPKKVKKTTEKPEKSQKTKDKKKSNRAEKQFSTTRPVLLPPKENEIVEDKKMEKDVTSEDDKKNIENDEKNNEETLKNNNFEQKSQDNAPIVSKPKPIPSMQYRFSNKNFNKSVEEENKKKNLQSELDEILRQARQNLATSKEIPQNTPFPQKRVSVMPENVNIPRIDDEFMDIRQKPISELFAQKRQFFQGNKVENPSDSISLNDFDLNSLPNVVKRKIILAYFAGKFSD